MRGQYALFLCLINSALILSWLLQSSHFGFDLTDEGFYLNWISDPFSIPASTTQFGFIYHPLYLLFDGDIALLRQSNLIISFVLAWILMSRLIRSSNLMFSEVAYLRYTLSTGMAVYAMASNQHWLITPSYNSLNFQALVITCIGLTKTEKEITFHSAMGWIIVGVGGWLCFMAKPTSAVALAICVALYSAFTSKLSVQTLCIAVITSLGLLLASAWIIDGSVIKFISRVHSDILLLSKMDGGYNTGHIFRVDFFLPNLNTTAIALILGVSFWLCTKHFENKHEFGWSPFTVNVLFSLIIYAIIFGLFETSTGLGRFRGLLIFGVVLPALAIRLSKNNWSTRRIFRDTDIRFALFFLCLPLVYAFGSNGNYWQIGGGAGLFWAVAGYLSLHKIFRKNDQTNILVSYIIVIQVAAVSILHTAMTLPYRQDQPLHQNTHIQQISAHQSEVYLSENFANYISSAQNLLKQAKFSKGTPIIDMTGRSPGLIYAVGGKSSGQAWMLGGYAGSLARAKAVYEMISCNTISQSWILTEQNGTLNIPMDFLDSLGINWNLHYQIVGVLNTPTDVGGRAHSMRQFIYKPIQFEDIEKSCNISRAKIL